MLLEFGIKNFFSFKEGANISFRLDANCPASISNGKNFATLLCIKGANGSGKTQVLKGLSFLSHFCTDSFSTKPDGPTGVLPFFDSTEPSEFYAEFSIGSEIYRYELATTEHEVKREAIYRTRSKKVKILERVNNSISMRINSLSGLDNVKLRKNASIISTSYQYELPQLEEVYMFFRAIITNVSFSGLHEEPINVADISKYLSEDKDVFDFVKDFIMDCDIGISDIEIHSFKNKSGNDEMFPMFFHEVNGVPHIISDLTESSGTKSLFRRLSMYKDILRVGGVLALDEFDLNLHPHILPKLLNLFSDSDINVHNAQLIFSTHDSAILNYLGRYRSYLVAKDNNESYVYRLDEIPGDILRNDRPISPIYNEGRIGGVPRV
ncbi:AAA family ATPase [Janthinobacterium sp. Mn2066]|uniref:AAA family ATPase n=1 Tax=Janthinobacterium sp. Mn2066 TaxID=3395264 RepID=UPI003BD07870